jgi:hypothetical protein
MLSPDQSCSIWEAKGVSEHSGLFRLRW